MAISNYNRECGYRLGRLNDHIYLVDKSHKLKYLADDLSVEIVSPLSDVKRCKTYLTIFNQSENDYGKYRFENTLELTLLEEYTNAMFPVLSNLRLNKYYVIIEDKDGTQYMLNPDADMVMSYEYTFTSADEEQNTITITLKNIQNHPLLMVQNRVTEYTDIYDSQCKYNFSQSYWLRMSLFGDIKIKDNNGELEDVDLANDDPTVLKTIDFLPKSFSMTESYEDGYFTVTMKFNIELSEFKYTFPYNLIEFSKNRYSAVFATHNNNLIFCGINSPLVPKYQITTSEDDGTLNIVTITLTSVSLYPSLVRDYLFDYRWVDANDNICVGWDLYQQLKLQISMDFGNSWADTNKPYKLGELIEKNSPTCGWHKQYRWIDDGEGCAPPEVKEVYRFIKVENEYICENGCKYEKLEIYKSNTVDGEFTPTGLYVVGDIIDEGSTDCDYLAVAWELVEDEYYYEEVNEELTQREGEQYCEGTTLMFKGIERVTSDGVNYYQTTDGETIIELEQNSCQCGYYYLSDWYNSDEFACGSEIGYTSTVKYRKQYRDKMCGDKVLEAKVEYQWVTYEYQSCDCGYYDELSDWYDSDEFACGSELGGNYSSTTKYRKQYRDKICGGNVTETKFESKWVVFETQSCDCGYYTISNWENEEILCGSEISEEYPPHNKYQKQNKYKMCGGERIEVYSTKYVLLEENSFDCGYIKVKYKLVDENICGDVLPDNTEIVTQINNDDIIQE